MESQLQKQCKIAASAFNNIVELIFTYDLRKGFSRPWFRKLTHSEDIWKDFPEEWTDQVKGVLSTLAVMGPVSQAAGFWRMENENLPPNERDLARIWRVKPWRVVAFRNSSQAGKDLHWVEGLGTSPRNWSSEEDWKKFPVYSPALTSREFSTNQIILTVLWPGFGAWHTYGPVICLNGWTESDLEYLMERQFALQRKAKTVALLTPGTSSEPLSDRLSRSPLTAQLTFGHAGMPLVEGPLGSMEDCCSVFLGEIPPLLKTGFGWTKYLQGKGQSPGSLQDLTQGLEVYLGKANVMRDPWFLVLPKKNAVFLCAWSLQAYSQGRQTVADLLDFPEVPQRTLSLPGLRACLNILPQPADLRDLVQEELQFLSEMNSSQAESSLEIQKTQHLVAKLTDNHNEGRKQSADELAQELDLPLELVEEMMASLNSTLPPFLHTTREKTLELPPRALQEFSTPGVEVVYDFLELREQGTKEYAELLKLLEGVPIIKVLRWMVDKSLFHGGRIPITPAGYLATFLVREAHSLFHSLDSSYQYIVSPKKESDWPWLGGVRRLLEHACFFRQDAKGLLVSRETAEHLEATFALWQKLRIHALSRWNWSRDLLRFNPFHDIESKSWALFYALGRFSAQSQEDGKWVELEDWAEAYWDLDYREDRRNLADNDQHRIFMEILLKSTLFVLACKGPLGLLGLVEVHPEDKGRLEGNQRLRPTKLARELYSFRHPNDSSNPC